MKQSTKAFSLLFLLCVEMAPSSPTFATAESKVRAMKEAAQKVLKPARKAIKKPIQKVKDWNKRRKHEQEQKKLYGPTAWKAIKKAQQTPEKHLEASDPLKKFPSGPTIIKPQYNQKPKVKESE